MAKKARNCGVVAQVADGIHARIRGRAGGHGDVTGDVISTTPRSVKVRSRWRASPTGPWFEHIFTVPRRQIDAVARGDRLVCADSRAPRGYRQATRRR